MPQIVLKNIVKSFGKSVAVDDLNLTIEDGEFVTLLGPSGCGKTTTLRMIAGLETPTSGEISIDGRVVFSSHTGVDLSPDKRDVGFLFQNYALWPHMTVYKNISFGLKNMKWDKARIDARVQELCEMLQIESFLERYPSELSGGQQQRVAIARTLSTGPKALFMDEPLSNLDAKLRMEMRTELKRLHTETGATFVYVTHDQLEAMTLSTRICLMRLGVLQQVAPPLEVYQQPANTFVADFVGSPNINVIDMTAVASGHAVTLRGSHLELDFVPGVPVSIAQGQELIVGVRPEHIRIADQAAVSGRIISSLPSGMETIVHVGIGDAELTSVVFGSVDFAVGQRVGLEFPTDKHVLFDKTSGDLLATGSFGAIRALV